METSQETITLNDAQRTAVEAPLGNTLVLAGAGSGKTRVLVTRIAELVRTHRILPAHIMAVTFTNKAAQEMKHRLHHIVQQGVSDMWIGTFHSLCHRFLRRHYREAGLPSTFHILDSGDQARLIKQTIQACDLDEQKWPIKQVQHFINTQKDEGIRAAKLPAPTNPYQRTMTQLYHMYETRCQQEGILDFAELLIRVYELFYHHPDITAHYQERFRAILIDEFQDTNTIQYALIKILTTPITCVMAVGDDDQSIYGWRGAKIENIQRFQQDFPNTTLVRLEQNYRSTANILQAANHLIQKNDERMGKNLWTQGDAGEKISIYPAMNEIEEARYVAEHCTRYIQKGLIPRDIAILYRSNAQSRVLEEAFVRTGIPYRIYAGVRFFERAEIKDALAYLRLMVYPDDNYALERIINVPARGIGDKTIEQLKTIAHNHGTSLWQALQHTCTEGHFPTRAQRALEQFVTLIATLKEKIDGPLDTLIQTIITHSGLQAHLESLRSEGAARLENLQELINAGRQFDSEQVTLESDSVLQAFLAHTALEGTETSANPHDPSVHLMTLHAAKGLEFPVVFIVGMEEGLFPTRASVDDPLRLQEERRLCYVGMTRAKKKLILSYAKIRRLYGREERHHPSRFLRELPAEILESTHTLSRAKETNSGTHIPYNGTQNGIQVGEQVEHHIFGIGRVINTDGEGVQARVHVTFENAGTKWLVLAYANLKRLKV